MIINLIIRGFTPEQGVWEGCFPLLGVPWLKDVNWLFREILHPMDGRTNLFERFFLHGNKSLHGLLHNKPKPTHYDEYLRQCLLWNPLFTTPHGLVLGFRYWLAWGKITKAPDNSLKTW